jgi:hypothetical protein
VPKSGEAAGGGGALHVWPHGQGHVGGGRSALQMQQLSKALVVLQHFVER